MPDITGGTDTTKQANGSTCLPCRVRLTGCHASASCAAWSSGCMQVCKCVTFHRWLNMTASFAVCRRSTCTSHGRGRRRACSAPRAPAPRTKAMPSARPAPWATTRPVQVRSAAGSPACSLQHAAAVCMCAHVLALPVSGHPLTPSLPATCLGCSLGVPGGSAGNLCQPHRRHLCRALVSGAGEPGWCWVAPLELARPASGFCLPTTSHSLSALSLPPTLQPQGDLLECDSCRRV